MYYYYTIEVENSKKRFDKEGKQILRNVNKDMYEYFDGDFMAIAHARDNAWEIADKVKNASTLNLHRASDNEIIFATDI